MSAGRYAPSPTGDLHLGNLRTALLAWLFAGHTGRDFLLRMEDLDRGRFREEAAASQLRDLAALGLTHHGTVVWQSERTALYRDALEKLTAAGRTFECFCSRKDIQEAASAPHTRPGHYPGTCLRLTAAARDELRASKAPAIRYLSRPEPVTVQDAVLGSIEGIPDHAVLRRGDGEYAYNLAVVVDDGLQGVDQVVRGDDLATSAPTQASLARDLHFPIPSYAHVPLALNEQGKRLAKRDGAVTMAQLRQRGMDAPAVRDLLAESLGLPTGLAPMELLQHFDPERIPHRPWIVKTP